MDLETEALAALGAVCDNWDASEMESQSLDFKQTPDRSHRKQFLKDLAESVVCFANSEGGVLVVGVADRAETRNGALVGVDLVHWPLQDLVSAIHQRTSPSITVRTAVIPFEGKTFYALGVLPGSDVFGTTEGVYKIRLHNRCVPLVGQELRGLRALRLNEDWSAEPAEAEWDALSRAAVEMGARRLRMAGHDELAGMALTDLPSFGRATGLEARDGTPNRAAVLLYGTPEALARIPGWGVNVQTRQSPGGEPRILMRGADTIQPLSLLIDHLISLLETLATSHVIRAGAEQVELVDYPSDALREIIANAFAHRDWEAAGVVEVLHSPEELTVTSPGGLLPTLRVDRLLHDASAPRNRALSLHMARLRLSEMSGLGFDRVFRSVALLGKEPPILEDGPRFRVTLNGGTGDEAFARFVRGPILPHSMSGDVDVLTVLTALRNHRSVNSRKLVDRLQRNQHDVERVLERMQREGLVQPTKSTARRAMPNYVLSPKVIAGLRTALTYRSIDIDAEDEKLLRHLSRYRTITNEDVRNYLDCDMATARNRLTRLRKKRLIDFAADSPRRGPKVEYVATSATDTSSPSTTNPDADPDDQGTMLF